MHKPVSFSISRASVFLQLSAVISGLFLACNPVRANSCQSNEASIDGLCWSTTRQSVVFADAKAYCADRNMRLPTEEEVLRLFTLFQDKEEELGNLLGLKGIPLMWIEQEPENDKVKVALPRGRSTMTMSPESKLYAQCVRDP